jgi:hypothetical protein
MKRDSPIHGYLRESKRQLSAGRTMQFGQKKYLRFIEPREEERFLHGEDDLLVVEVIGTNEINQ